MEIRRLILSSALVTACLHDPAAVDGPIPVFEAAWVTANPDNVLSAVVIARVSFANGVAVRYRVSGATVDSITPAVMPRGDIAVVPVLGLLPDTQYTLTVVALGGGHVVTGDSMTFSTESLPTDLPSYAASGTDPSPGLVAFAAGMYGLVIDNTGRVVWYHRFPTGPGLNFQPQPNGRYVAHPGTPDPSDHEPWVEIDPLGNVTRTFGCAGLPSRFHDLLVQADGSYWIMCDETRTLDLSAMGGVVDARVTGTVVQWVSAEGALLFQWSPFDHFAITDLPAVDRAGQNVNWTHGNALDLDPDGNLVVSFRSLSEITKIDTRTGAVRWRMGGLRNQFTFQGAPAPGFARQHGMRLPGAGRLTLLDNLGDPAGSRAERYVVDEASRNARLVASYGPSPAVQALLGGTTQEVPGGRALVAFGSAGRVEEYDSSGALVWHIEGNSGYVFRAQRIRSLYGPGVGSAR